MKSKFVSMIAAGVLVTLAGCGGGGGGDDAPAVGGGEETAVPDSALQSPESYSRWVAAREASERREALQMNAMTPPTSETAEPIDVE